MSREKLSAKIRDRDLASRAVYVSTYPPRECGIATYTRELLKAINILNPRFPADVIAIEDLPAPETRQYPWEVKYRINQFDLKSWLEAADYINSTTAEVVNLQHEFGIYGGECGDYILPFMRRLKKPIVTTFHTVLSKGGDRCSEITRQIVELSSAVIVMIEAAVTRLVDVHHANPEKLVVIPHGVPDIPFGGTPAAKKALHLGSAPTITSFGLINSGKRIEKLILALPLIHKKFPETKLLIIGETHPVVKRREGEAYRESLIKLAQSLGIEKKVVFVNRYLTLAEIINYLRATDIFVTPYDDLNQISSGTLAYAISAGKACVSTPYLYAKEALGNDRGVLVKNNSPALLAKSIIELLSDEKYRDKLAKRAYQYGRNMIWPKVGLNYLEVFDLVSKSDEP